MTQLTDPFSSLNEIKSMMEKSSRFLSLSGLSGVAAGLIGLVGAGFAYLELTSQQYEAKDIPSLDGYFTSPLFCIAIVTLIISLMAGFLFTYLKSKKLQSTLWNHASRRMLINLGLPLVAGGLYLLKLMDLGYISMIAPGCLLFYGLALVNASKYTLGDIRYLGYIEIGLGAINLLLPGYGLYFWALGFGVAHILYGGYMWNKYDKKSS
ncbi:MAG: hypothetical protein WAT88_18450 [Saprospiraceae bacterium]